MSEEEKTTLEFIKINNKHRYCDKNDVDFLLNLIEKQQKELDNLKEIEKSHKEENGKLRVEFEKVYEDNLTLAKELEQYKLLEANIDKANKIIDENKFDEGLYGLLMQEKEKNNNLIKQLQEQNTEIQNISRQLRKEKNKNTGKLVKNKIDGTIGIVLREWKTGQVQVLEKIQPKVINTHDSWETLELLEEK